MRRTLVMHKSRLNVILKIKEEKGTESLKTYIKSTWLIISRQRRIDTKKRYRNILQRWWQGGNSMVSFL